MSDTETICNKIAALLDDIARMPVCVEQTVKRLALGRQVALLAERDLPFAYPASEIAEDLRLAAAGQEATGSVHRAGRLRGLAKWFTDRQEAQ